jgi:hypothetical protein
MNDEQILKKKHQKFIVQSASDEDDQLVEMKTDDIIDLLINSFGKCSRNRRAAIKEDKEH